MDKLRCIVVDDEPLAVRMLENYIARTPFLELEASFSDPVAALSEISARQPHMAFLDIQMPDLDGLELSRMLPTQTRIIFTTAFKQYAFESYEVSALDFLLKPVRYQKFLEAAEKARQWFEMKEAAAGASAPREKSEDDGIFIKSDRSMQKVLLSDILYVSGMKDYVTIRLASRREPLVTHITMKAVSDLLPRGTFMRVHRSYIVSLPKISSVTGTGEILIGEKLIPVSEAYREDFENYLKANSLTT